MSTTQLSVTEDDLRRAGQIASICDTLATGATIATACEEVGITTRTWRNWRQQGLVQEMVAATYDDLVVGARTLITGGVIEHLKILTSFAAGKVPVGVNVIALNPREIIVAGKQMMDILGKMGITFNTQEREQKDLLLQLVASKITIQQMVVVTENTGTANAPRPEPIGVIEGSFTHD